MSVEVKERLSELYLRTGSMGTQQTRDFYMLELESQLGQELNIPRYPDAKRDIWSLINACLMRPGALGKFTQVVSSFSKGSHGMADLERLVAEIERQTLLTSDERDALIQLLAEVPADLITTARDGLADELGQSAPTESTPRLVVEYVEELAEAAKNPLTLLGFVDTLAHRISGRAARALHGWIDGVANRLYFDSGEIRDLCLRSLQGPTGESDQAAARAVDHPDEVEPEDTPASLDGAAPPGDPAGGDMRSIHDLPRTALEPVALPRIWGGVPFRNPNFTGREVLLRRLREELRRHAKTSVLPQTLHGYGGVGKTQLAIEYVYRYAERYDLVWWVSAERRTEVLASLVELGERLGVAASQDRLQHARAVLDALGGTRYRWLLVYDNAERPDELISLVPSAGGHVVLTSRNADWATRWNAIEVDVFQRTESVQLLGRRDARITPGAADLLADKLGDLPLALEQAANFQLTTGMSVEEYLELFDDRVRELLDEGQPSDYHTTTTAFLTLALERLRAASPAAAELLELFACLGPEPIAAGVLREGRSADLSAPLRRALRDPIQMNRIIRQLSRYGLARVDPHGQRIQVHRLVQAVLRTELDEDRWAQSLANVRNLLGQANPSHPDDRGTWSGHAELGPHILAADLVHADGAAARLVVLDQARYLFQIGDYTASQALGQAMVDQWCKPPVEGGLGGDHEQSLLARRHLANALRMLGGHARARELDEEAFELLRASPAFGDDHEHTVGVALGLGFDRSMANDLPGALRSDQENLERSMRVYGPDDEHTVNARGNVAAVLRQLGRFQEAHEISAAIVGDYRRAYGQTHPRTLWFITYVVADLYGLGRYRQALDRQLEHWAAASAALAPHSREFLLGEHNIAIALRKTGQHNQALARARDNHRALHTHLGADHEYTLAAAMARANALRAAGRLAEARGVATDAVETYHRVFGTDHRLSLVAQVNQGIILRLLGERRTALTLEADTHQALAGMLGPDHPYTLASANNHASSLLLAHQVQQAADLAEQTLERSRRVRGPAHPDTLACAVNAALDWQSTTGDAPAQQRLDAALDALERVLGRNHPDTIDAIRGKRADCDIEPPAT
ncbi:MAG: tetratricopeptide repeat protein [Dactylosporangium sp.]|nr:tetratricopeptide repeat protein [Dactylosporangium sp.]NNJ60415.1 tetratricopeptide repeat protein [Dactylosporangium sp.]